VNATKAQRLKAAVNNDLDNLHRNVGDALMELKREKDSEKAEAEAAVVELSKLGEVLTTRVGEISLAVDMLSLRVTGRNLRDRYEKAALWLSIAAIVGWIVFVNLYNR
jgi:hypothetical protein